MTRARGRIVGALAAMWLAGGCVRPCKSGTVLLTLDYAGDAARADSVTLHLVVGARFIDRTVARHPGDVRDSVEIDFPGGYPRAQSITIDALGAAGGAAIARGHVQAQLGQSCSALALPLASASSGGADLFPSDGGAALASQLAFTAQPMSVKTNAAIAPAVQVAFLDGNGDLVASESSSVTLALASNGTSGALGGVLTVNAVGGVATFSNLVIDTAGSYTLSAASGLLPPATSARFTIEARAWEVCRDGLYGGVVSAFAVAPSSPSTLYAATPRVYRSNDGGVSWSRASFGLDAGATWLAVDPKVPSTVYAVGVDYGFYRSTNSGSWWERLSNVSSASRLFIDGRDGDVIYKHDPTSMQDDWHRSRDGGETWQAWPVSNCTDLLFDQTNPRAFLCYRSDANGASLPFFYRSLDDGVTWSLVDAGITSVQGTAVSLVASAAVDNAGNAYLVWDAYYTLPKGAMSWVKLGSKGFPPLRSWATSLTVDPDNPSHAFIAWDLSPSGGLPDIAQTQDGVTFAPMSFPFAGSQLISWPRLALDPSVPGSLYASGAPDGLFKFDGRANKWTLLNRGMDSASVRRVASAPTEPFVYAVSADQLFVSADQGLTFTQAAITGAPPGRAILSLAVDQRAGKTVYVFVDGIGLQKSVDAAATFTTMTTQHGAGELAANGQYVVDNSNAAGLYCSADGGATWSPTAATNTSFNKLVFDPQNLAQLYADAFTANTHSLQVSSDGGAHWALSGTCSGAIGNRDVVSWIGTGANHKVYFEAGLKLFVSSDAGQTCSGYSANPGFLLVADPNNDSVFLGFATRAPNTFEVQRSADAGVTFAKASDGFTGKPLQIAAIPSLDNGFLIPASTALYRTTSGGR